MNKFKKMITRYSEELKRSENVPEVFQKAWQWFWEHRDKVSSGLEEDKSLMMRYIVAMALAEMRKRNVKYTSFKQWGWDKDASAMFYRQKDNLNKCYSNGILKDKQTARLLGYQMVINAVELVDSNPAQALYFLDFYDRNVINSRAIAYSASQFERLLNSLPLLNVDDELLPTYQPEKQETKEVEDVETTTYWGWGMFETPRVRTFKEALKSLEWASTWLQCTDVLYHWFHSHPELNEEEFVLYATQLADNTNDKGMLTPSQAKNCNAILMELKKDFGLSPIKPLFVASQPEPEETPSQPGEEVSRIGPPAAPADTPQEMEKKEEKEETLEEVDYIQAFKEAGDSDSFFQTYQRLFPVLKQETNMARTEELLQLIQDCKHLKPTEKEFYDKDIRKAVDKTFPELEAMGAHPAFTIKK